MLRELVLYKILLSVCFYTLPVYTGCGIIRALFTQDVELYVHERAGDDWNLQPWPEFLQHATFWTLPTFAQGCLCWWGRTV